MSKFSLYLLAFTILLSSCSSGTSSSNAGPVSSDDEHPASPSQAPNEDIIPSADSVSLSAQVAKPYEVAGFVRLTDVVPDVILEMRYYTTYNFVGARIDGYEAPVALCTREAAVALQKASALLRKQGYRIKIFDAYRPQMAVDHFMRWVKDLSDTAMKPFFYPDIPKSQIMPQSYLSRHSGHTRGSTFDLTLVDESTGREVDMGGSFDFLGERSHYTYIYITDEQRKNRQLLRDAMTASGFRPLPHEWWHFTLRNEPYPDTYFAFPVL